jgi:uncharacterized membrane protein YbhN (UPF0104 family)
VKSDRRLSRLLRGIGFVLLVVLLWKSDPAAIGRVLSGARFEWVALAALLIFPMLAFKTARWRLLQRAVGISPAPFGDSYRAYFEGLFLGLVTPGRMGEFVRVRHLTAHGAPLGTASATVLWDRIIDVLGLLALGTLALLPLAGDFRGLYLGTLVVLTLGVVAGIALVFAPPGRPKGLRSRIRGLLEARTPSGGRVAAVGGDILAASRQFRGSVLPLSVLWTLGGWVLYYAQAWSLARALAIPLPLLPLVVSVTAAAVMAFLPLSISGIGTRDAALVILFGRFGRPPEEALGFSALVLLMMVLNALFGFLASRGRRISPATKASIDSRANRVLD